MTIIRIRKHLVLFAMPVIRQNQFAPQAPCSGEFNEGKVHRGYRQQHPSPPPHGGAIPGTSQRREVTTMIHKLREVLRLSSKPAPRDATPSPFDGHVLDRKREDVYVLMHQIGLIR
jgi:hypothetical protein